MRPILIAECCQNHKGDRDLLGRMIWAAAENGADYAKIQSLRSSELAYRERFESGRVDADGRQTSICRPFAPERDRLAGLDLSDEDERLFVDECYRAGISPLITAFTRGAVARLSAAGFPAVKIASYDCPAYPLLRDVRARWSTIFVSTGGCHDHEILRAAQELAGTDAWFLHCVTRYPTPLDHAHLRRMAWLRRFTPRVGWSDHSLTARDGLRLAKLALALGADVIERHFTVAPASETRDGPVSITPEMLAELRRFADLPRYERMANIRAEWPGWELALGEAHRALTHEELLNRDYYAGRVATWSGDRQIFNWEDVPLSGPHEPGS